jgi:hypothetical protein
VHSFGKTNCNLEFLQENYQVQQSDKRLARPPTQDQIIRRPPPQRKRPEVSGQKESAIAIHVPETQETSLQSHERERWDNMQSTQTAHVAHESATASDVQSLHQHVDDGINTTRSVVRNTSEEKRYNIRSWLKNTKENTLVKNKKGSMRIM